jgi:hypothetical protein
LSRQCSAAVHFATQSLDVFWKSRPFPWLPHSTTRRWEWSSNSAAAGGRLCIQPGAAPQQQLRHCASHNVPGPANETIQAGSPPLWAHIAATHIRPPIQTGVSSARVTARAGRRARAADARSVCRTARRTSVARDLRCEVLAMVCRTRCPPARAQYESLPSGSSANPLAR